MDRLPSVPSRYGSVPARVWIGSSVELVPQRVAAAGWSRVWLVTDKGLRKAGHADLVMAALQDVEVAVFDDVEPHPTAADVGAAVEVARAFRPDGIVALGGGSVLDTAKGVAMLLGGGARMQDWWGFGKVDAQVVPLIAVPATAGTGSEVQSFALISRTSDGVKMACGAVGAMPLDAVLDRTIVRSVPRSVAAIAVVDALVHAVETAVTTVGTDESRALAQAAFVRLVRGAAAMAAGEGGVDDRMIGACMAGQAIEASMLGAAHALANPLTARFGVPHGVAVGATVPHVVRYNAARPAIAATYAALALSVGWGDDAEALASGLEDLFEALGVVRSARAWAPKPPEGMVAEAMAQWTGTFNPRPLRETDVASLYAELWAAG